MGDWQFATFLITFFTRYGDTLATVAVAIFGMYDVIEITRDFKLFFSNLAEVAFQQKDNKKFRVGGLN